MLAPIDSDIMADFVNNLDRINALAEQSEGFVWRLAEEGNNATTVQLFDHEFYIVNMSVWTSVDALFQFTYKTAHVEIFKRRKEWFSKMQDMHMALWYVEAGTIPSTSEAKRRLDYLNANGESPYSFTFKRNFTLEESLNYKPVKC